MGSTLINEDYFQVVQAILLEAMLVCYKHKCKLLSIKAIAKSLRGSLCYCAYCGLSTELANLRKPFLNKVYAFHQCCR